MSEIATIDATPADDGQGDRDNLPDTLNDVIDGEIVDDGDDPDTVDGEVLGDDPEPAAPTASTGAAPVPPTRPIPSGGGGGGGGAKLGGSRQSTSLLAAVLAALWRLLSRLWTAVTGQRGQDKRQDVGQWSGPVAWMSAEWRAARKGQGQSRGHGTGQARGQRTGRGAVHGQDKPLSRTGQRTAGRTVARTDRTGQDPTGPWWT